MSNVEYAQLAFELTNKIFNNHAKAYRWLMDKSLYFSDQSPFDICMRGEGQSVISFIEEKSDKIL